MVGDTSGGRVKPGAFNVDSNPQFVRSYWWLRTSDAIRVKLNPSLKSAAHGSGSVQMPCGWAAAETAPDIPVAHAPSNSGHRAAAVTRIVRLRVDLTRANKHADRQPHDRQVNRCGLIRREIDCVEKCILFHERKDASHSRSSHLPRSWYFPCPKGPSKEDRPRNSSRIVEDQAPVAPDCWCTGYAWQFPAPTGAQVAITPSSTREW